MTNSSKTLIIDCQVFQTASWHRGMGKYSYSLLEAMLEHSEATKYNIVALFNDAIDIPKEIITFLDRHHTQIEPLKLSLGVPHTPRDEYSVEKTIRDNKQKLNYELASRYDNYSFFIMALYLDEVCPVFPDAASEKTLVYYDAIPYLYHERYDVFKGFFENFYYPHTKTVYEATKLLTISKTVANDLCITFGLPKERIFTIDGASIPRLDIPVRRPKISAIKSYQYVLMPTGQELRKNNIRAAQGFARFKKDNPKSKLKLVVTSTFTDEGRAAMKKEYPDVVFTGNVSESEIKWLYDNCSFLLFPSEYEGLGLPILEAIDSKKRIVCSDISVFREISKSAFAYFDPLRVEAIANAIERTASVKDEASDYQEEYRKIKDKYTWRNSATAVYKALSKDSKNILIKKKKVAIFTPDPSGFSAIGKVVTESHARYAEFFDITYYFDRGPNHRAIRPNPLVGLAPYFNAEDFTENDYGNFDAVIYHIGNSEYHLNTVHVALACPGYVILHDTYLAGAFANLLDLGYISRDRYDAEKKLDELLQDDDNDSRLSSFLTTVLNNQKAVMVHSNYAKQAVEKVLLDPSKIAIEHANLPVSTPLFPEIVKPKLQRPVISFAGIIATVKGTAIIEDIARSDEFLGCDINVFGYSAVEPELLVRLKQLSHVRLVTNPSDFEFQRLMASTDILINVRLEYKGETSLTTLEAMRFGGVVLLRNFGWYAELPDNVVVKVASPDQVLDALREVLRDKARQKKISNEAFEHVKSDFCHLKYAEAMHKLIIAKN